MGAEPPPVVPAAPPPEGVVPAPPEGVVPVLPEGVVPVLPEGVVPVPAEVVDELLFDVVVDELITAALLLAPEVGTVKPGAPAVLVVPEPPLPQAVRQRAAVAMAAPALAADRWARRFISRIVRASGAEWLHPPAAVGAIVEVLRSELIAPIAEAEVLHRPRQLGGRGGEGQHQTNDFKLLAGLAISVHLIRLRLDDHLAAGGWCPHPVLLAGPHSGQCYQCPGRQGWRGFGGSAMMPRAWIECGPERMERAVARPFRSLAALVSSGMLMVVLGGCAVKHPVANVVNGKVLFVKGCASCHTLAHANSAGVTGPNLDDAFRQDRADGVKSSSIQGLVSYWIQFPNDQGVMPAKIFKGQAAQDVAAYVGLVAARPGVDSGALASAVPTVNQKPAVEKSGVLQIDRTPGRSDIHHHR